MVNQKVITVNNSDTDINAVIAAQNAGNWIVSLIILSGTDVIILFNEVTSPT